MGFINKIAQYIIEGRLIKVTLNAIWRFICKLPKRIRGFFDWGLAVPARLLLCYTNKVNPKKVMFMSFNNEYMCNPKYILEEINRQQLPLELVWGVTNKQLKNRTHPKNVKLVVRGTFPFFKEIVTAKVWVDNALCFTWNPIPKKKDQFYLQTWHGSLGLKRIGKENVRNSRWSFAANLAKKWTDLCISNSTFETEVFRQTHWPKTEILELGHARNDVLFLSDEQKAEIKAMVLEYYGIEEGKKIALYAPTFRNNDSVNCYDLDHSRFLNALEQRFGGEWVLLNRYHFKTKAARKAKVEEIDERILSATDYPDIQELMVASDVGITDYSSWICDFVLTGRPGFIYAPDLADYDQERGFYYPLNETPFPIAEDNDELEARIHAFDADLYARRSEQFLIDRGCKEEGDAAKKIVEIIKQQCGLTCAGTSAK